MLDRAAISEPFPTALQSYLADTLQAAVVFEAWVNVARLPIFLAKRYRFYRTTISHRPCLVMALATEVDVSPADVSKHISLVTNEFDGVVIFAAEAMNATIRSRLITQGVPFIVPGNQLFIPQLAMDLRDHFRAPPKKRGDQLSPTAQLVLFHHILLAGDTRMTPTMLAEPLKFAAMSIGRAFDQLADTALAKVERRGRQKLLHYRAERRMLFDLSRAHLRTPVRGVRGVRFKAERPAMLRAGETALADLTDLAPPDRPTYAVVGTDWHELRMEHEIEAVNDLGLAEAFIEIWLYDPHTLSNGDTVDPLSLHAQFWNHPDERVAQAAVAVLEQVPW